MSIEHSGTIEMRPKITGVILAGGRSSRMGGNDKGLIQLSGKPLFQHVIDRFSPQVDDLMINANRNQMLYQESGIPVISDIITGFVGPLAGMHSGLSYSSTEWVVFAPCDVPDLPLDLVFRLWQSKGQALAAYVSDSERTHPTFSLMHISQKAPLAAYLAGGERKLMMFLESIRAQRIIFSGKSDIFDNLNTPADCHLWERKRRGE